MKKTLTMILGALMVTLTGCGTPKEVPDTLVMSSLEDRLGTEKSIEITTHEPDQELHRDTVSFKATKTLEYGTILQEGTITYEYEKANDLWRRVNYFASEGTEVYNPDAFLQHCEGVSEGAFAWYDKYDYDINITHVDFDHMTMTLEGTVTVISQYVDEHINISYDVSDIVDVSGEYPLTITSWRKWETLTAAGSVEGWETAYGTEIYGYLFVTLNMYRGINFRHKMTL